MSLNSKKICILTSVHPPFDPRIFHKQAKTLVKAGYEVVLIAPHVRDELVEKIKIQAVPKPRNRIERVFLTSLRIFRKALKEKADIYHSHDPELLLAVLFLKYITKKPVIYDVHEYYSYAVLTKYWIPNFLRNFVSIIIDFVEKNISKRLSAIIAINDHMKNIFLKYNVESISVYNYPTKDFLDNLYILENSPKEINFNNKIVTYVGAISKDRGYETILEAMLLVREKYPIAICQLIGTIDVSGVKNKYITKQKEYYNLGGIEVIGRIPYKEIPKYLANCDITWVPRLPTSNQILGLPTKLFEYMVCGKPIVASKIGFTSEIIEDAKCGILVDPADPKSHAEAIVYLIDHPEEAERLGKNGRRAVLEKHNWEKEGKKLLDIYFKLLGE